MHAQIDDGDANGGGLGEINFHAKQQGTMEVYIEAQPRDED